MKRTIITIILTFALAALVVQAAEQSAISTDGVIESKSGGFKFPDGSIQTAATPSSLEAQIAELEGLVTDLEAAIQVLQESSQNIEQCFDRYDYFGGQSVQIETQALHYQASNSSADLSIEMLDSWAAGTYPITDASYANCSECVLIQESNGNYFLADSGTLTITSTDDTSFTGTLNGAHLVEVTIDDATFDSTPVSNGETRCLDNYQFNAVPAAPVPENLFVQLTWDTPGDADQTDEGSGVGADMDLHLRHPTATGWFDIVKDCHWANINPDWGVAFNSLDDPELTLDDADGLGPENIEFIELETGVVYRVGVHYSDDHGFGPSTPMVKLFWEGVKVAELTASALAATDYFWEAWDVEQVDGSLVVTVLDSVTSTPPPEDPCDPNPCPDGYACVPSGPETFSCDGG